MKLTGFAGLPDGSEWVRDTIDREASDPSAAGLELAHRMAAAGASELLERAAALQTDASSASRPGASGEGS
jgi:porphobilinogen deaminase